MSRRFFVLFIMLAIVLPLSFFGCKGKVENASETEVNEMTQGMAPQTIDTLVTTEPAQTIATETIPPTAAPQIAFQQAPVKAGMAARNKDIQLALKNAGFYTGSIDGKIGPKTKSAIVEFQKARGLKADGKVGPKTWAELEKYLVEQVR
ncbi:MAG: peptidoglycan-binding domain-containing protein [Candidatus Omnitrophota bacterium]|nr:peptidoglycan-binding domain-containing protein [Candidatus Omnitrophota bacterium]